MAYLTNLYNWIVNQLVVAGSAVVYVSWITAGIFAVLAVFTIFLAHQFQTNTTESVKVTWKIRESIKDKKSDGLKELFQDFRYFSNIPKVITSSLETSKVIIYFLIFIWGVSGLVMIVNEIKSNDHNTFPILSILLIGISTILFIVFSYKLVQTIKQITTNDNNELTFKNIEELQSYKMLDENGFTIENAILLDDPTIEFEILNDEPFLDIFLERKYGFTGFTFMINITHPHFNVLLGTDVESLEEKTELKFQEQVKSLLNRILTEENLTICSYQLWMYINQKSYSFQLSPEINGYPFPNNIKLKLAKKTNWEPPIPQKEKLLGGEILEIIEMRDV